MSHPKIKEFQRRLKIMFDEIDDYLEDTYGDQWELHPNRPPRGSTASKSHDGLFNVGAQFSAGYGSEHGRGYAVDLRIVTLERVSEEFRQTIIDDLTAVLEEKLKTHFPERVLRVEEDRNGLKIVGNLTLGKL